jgi:putative ubiquitin-RnfH superfamily antitoxin RatB of RatAB toxin-antitoxin module
MGNSKISVEVAYALPGKQAIVPLEVEKGCSVYDAVQQSGIARQFAGLELDNAKLGIFGKAVSKPREREIHEGERVEIYRPLIADPKEVRKERAARVKAEKAAKK